MFYIADLQEILIAVEGLPPAKGGVSLLVRSHRHHERVLALLRATAAALPPDFVPLREAVSLSLTLFAPVHAPPGDPTNFLGGVADVLQRKAEAEDLGDLSRIFMYENDLQLRRVDFRQRFAPANSYELRVSGLGGPERVGPRGVNGIVGTEIVLDLVDLDEIALVFVNAMERRKKRDVPLVDATSLATWLALQGALSGSELSALLVRFAAAPIEADELFAMVRRLSGALLRLFLGERRSEDVDLLTACRRECAKLERIDFDSRPDLPLAAFEIDAQHLPSVMCPIVRSALRLLLPPVRRRLRACADVSCGRLFLDRTKNGTRTWCTMSTCGSRNKVRAFRQRHAQAALTTDS